MKLQLLLLSSISASLAAPLTERSEQSTTVPIVQITNGTIQGLHLETYNQDVFLGIPFAEPPLGELRFSPPVPYNTSWGDSPKVFDEYGYACIATGATDNSLSPQSEDCLTINVIRPAGYEGQQLPVGIWIYGGGFQDGTSRRPAYNLSYIVENSVELGKPIIGVSFNYRLGGYGFLGSQELVNKGWTNVGLRDQVQAINWVHENIQSFGGDANHLVIWGESAGGISVSKLLSSNQLGEDYIKGAIIESGPVTFPNTTSATIAHRQNDFETIVDYFNCTDAIDVIKCLQTVDAQDLHYVFNITNGVLNTGFLYPYIDGDYLSTSGYQSLVNGNFLKIPVLIGTSTDEGTSFVQQNLNTTEEFKSYLKHISPSLTNNSIDQLDQLYPLGDPLVSAPLDPTYNTTPIVYPEGITGAQYPRLATLYGDFTFFGGSRFAAKYYSQHSPVYKYRFNIPDLDTTGNKSYVGAAHFQEVVYVFDNDQAPESTVNGATWNPDSRSPDIAKRMSSMWVSFISGLDPNINQVYPDVPEWPKYSDGAQNYVFDLNGFYVETDDKRKEQIDFIETIISQLNA